MCTHSEYAEFVNDAIRAGGGSSLLNECSSLNVKNVAVGSWGLVVSSSLFCCFGALIMFWVLIFPLALFIVTGVASDANICGLYSERRVVLYLARKIVECAEWKTLVFGAAKR